MQQNGGLIFFYQYMYTEQGLCVVTYDLCLLHVICRVRCAVTKKRQRYMIKIKSGVLHQEQRVNYNTFVIKPNNTYYSCYPSGLSCILKLYFATKTSSTHWRQMQLQKNVQMWFNICCWNFTSTGTFKNLFKKDFTNCDNC